VAVVELQQLEQVGLEFCKETAGHLPARLVGLEILEFRLQLHHQRNQEAHLAHLEEDLEPLTLRLPEPRAAGDSLQI
jgi:hypothetical protein